MGQIPEQVGQPCRLITTGIAKSMKLKVEKINKTDGRVFPCDKSLSKYSTTNSTNFPEVVISKGNYLHIYLAQH